MNKKFFVLSGFLCAALWLNSTVVPATAIELMESSSAVAGISVTLDNFYKNNENAEETVKAIIEEEASPYSNIAVSSLGADNDYVNVRATASTEGEVLGKIYNNCAATILETVDGEGGTWYRIKSGSVTGYIKSEFFITGQEAEELALKIGKIYGRVSEGGLRLRAEANTDSEVITTLWSGEIYSVVEDGTDFVKISMGKDDDGNEVLGYVAKQYIDVYVKFDKAISLEEEAAKQKEAEKRKEEAVAAQSSSKRDAIVAYAKQFIGNPYVYGGTSLTRGTDCSGFTKGIYAHFGYSLSRTSGAQAGNGTRISVSQLQPGDLVFYASGGSIYHVAMYIGGGKIIHAIDEGRGIGITSMNYASVYCAVSVLG